MKLSPRYDGPPALVVDVPIGDPAVPMLRQRRRLASVLGSLDATQWSAPSRCAGWSTQDVVTHLSSTNQFWALSISSGRAGDPTRFLASFDPVATPAQMVAADRGRAPADALSQFIDSTDALEAALEGVTSDDWHSVTAEAPPGHIALGGVVLHALWDGWVHERDVVLPLGLAAIEEADEVVGCLHYSAALSPAFLATTGSIREGSLVIDGTDPGVQVVVDLGASARVHAGPAPADAPRLAGRSVDLVEGLSLRAPLPSPVDAEHAWMLQGLGRVFDTTG